MHPRALAAGPALAQKIHAMPRCRVLVPLLALACLSACKADDGIDSGLPASKPAAELQPDEQTQLCEGRARLHQRPPRRGRHQALPVQPPRASASPSPPTRAVAACVEARDTCIATPDEDPEPNPEPESTTCEIGIDWATCTATVDELEACFTEYTDQGADALNSFSCDRMAEYVKELPTYDPSILDPGPACQSAQAKCPSLELGVDDDEAMGSGEI
jgi:hypothetical protein